MRISDWSSDVCSSDLDSFLSRFSMRTKIMAVVGVACALLIAVSGLTLTRMSAMNDRTQDLHDENLVAMDQVHSLRNALDDARLQDSFKSLLTAYQQDPSQLDAPIATAYEIGRATVRTTA